MKRELRKQIGLYGLTLIAVGSCIGSGIFIVPSDIANHLASPVEIFGIWLLGGVVALTGALTFAELASHYPKAGGVYVYIREAFGKLSAFLYGWTILSVITSGALAALSLTFARYISFFVPMSQWGLVCTGVAAIVSTTLINLLGIRFSDVLASTTTAIKLFGVLAIVIAGIFLGTAVFSSPDSIPPGGHGTEISGFALAMIGVLWSFGGWHHASYLSAEVINPVKNVPRAMIMGALIVTAMYLSANWAYMRLLPISEIASSSAVAADALATVVPAGAVLVTILIACSTFGSIGIFTMSTPRIYYAMARDGEFFKFISRVHPKTQTPHWAIVIQSAWAIVILLFWGTFERIIASVVFMDWVFMILATMSIFVFRKRAIGVTPGYRTPGYPMVPLIFIAISTWFVIYTIIGRPQQALTGIVLLIVGIPVYFMSTRYNDKSGNVPPRE